MKLFMRSIAIGFLGYALMLFQANPAQATLFYMRDRWTDSAVLFFIIWFIASAVFLLRLARRLDSLRENQIVAYFFLAILPQLAYTSVAAMYFISWNILSQRNAQLGSLTTHGFGAIVLLTIVYYFHRGYTTGKWNGIRK